MEKQRYDQLDSLRGLAAITVVIYHYLLIFPIFFEDTFGRSGYYLVNLLKYSPLHMFFSGPQAVMLFFVLSGFVLSLPYINNNSQEYPVYITRRIARIYIPYIVSVIFAIIAAMLFLNDGIYTLSSWANGRWSESIRFQSIFQHFLLIGSFDNGKFNPVYWSLIHEMRISLIFPLIMLIVMKYSNKFSLISSIFVSGLGFVGTFFLGKIGIETDYLYSLYYGFTFVIGALLAKQKDLLIRFYMSKTLMIKIIFVICAVLLYTFPSWVRHIEIIPVRLLDPPNTIMTSIGSAMFIIIALASKSAKKILLIKPVHFVGKASYSLYLYHCIPLFALLVLFYEHIPTWLILILSLVITMLLTVLSYYLVEIPSIKLGKSLSSKIQSRRIKDVPLNSDLQ
jgi:peptidoglycan/LPS O-acetylase OafA/YrhL